MIKKLIMLVLLIGLVCLSACNKRIVVNTSKKDVVVNNEYINDICDVNKTKIDAKANELKENDIKIDIEENDNKEIYIEDENELVWITKTGKKYHKNSNCSNIKNAFQVTKKEAISKNKTKCKKCY